MSLILKSVWRGVLRPLVRSPLTTRSLASNVQESRARSPDVIMTVIREANTASAILAAVQMHLPVMTHRHLLHALRCLFELQKANASGLMKDSLINDPTFSLLCQNFKKHARALDVNEAIEATKVLIFLGLNEDAFILQTLLQLIRSQINMLNIRQIMFVDFLLSRFNTKNHLVDALKLALPLAFQIHLPMELDGQDLPLLRDMLSYCCTHDLPDRFINNVVTALLLKDQSIDSQVAKTIIWSLCRVECTEKVYPTRVQLLHICCDILTQNIEELSYDEVLRTAAKIKGRVLEKYTEYYHEQLMDAVANYVINKKVEFEQALLVARVLSRIAHTHLGLCEYLCTLATSNKISLATAPINVLFGFVNCLSNNNFTPPLDQWQAIRKEISANPVLEGRNSALPWAKFCLELASIGYFENKLLAKVFSKEFLDDHLRKGSSEKKMLDYLQMFTLHEAVNNFYSQQYKLPEDLLQKAKEMYPIHNLTDTLQHYLANGLGGPEYVAKNIVLPNGINSDLLLYLKNGYPVPLNRSEGPVKMPFDDLSLPRGGVVVCIMNFNQGCFSLNSSRLRGTFRLILDILEKQGYAAVAVNITEWLAAPAHERTPYLMREIGYKCGEIGMKLSAT